MPVRVHHLKRGWIYDVDTAHHPQLENTPYTAVGVQMDFNNFDSSVNGVIFPLKYDEISSYDVREARYERYEILNDDIELLHDDDASLLDSNSVVFAYVVPNDIVVNDESKRILRQSYIDKFISGCLEVDGTEFAVECIKTTSGWNGQYHDDRYDSEFSNRKISKNIKIKIDKLMNAHLPSLKNE